MQTEIKVKAWDSKLNKMLDGDDIENDPEIYAYLSYGKLVVSRDLLNGAFYELIPLQFTGSTDVTGVDIYEGGIVKWKGKDNIETVFFNEDDSSFQTETSCLDSTSFELLGNIYENLELMEEHYESIK